MFSYHNILRKKKYLNIYHQLIGHITNSFNTVICRKRIRKFDESCKFYTKDGEEYEVNNNEDKTKQENNFNLNSESKSSNKDNPHNISKQSSRDIETNPNIENQILDDNVKYIIIGTFPPRRAYLEDANNITSVDENFSFYDSKKNLCWDIFHKLYKNDSKYIEVCNKYKTETLRNSYSVKKEFLNFKKYFLDFKHINIFLKSS